MKDTHGRLLHSSRLEVIIYLTYTRVYWKHVGEIKFDTTLS